jgi:transposase
MTRPPANVIGGVDTHKHVHHAAVLAITGELLATAEFGADHRGYGELLAWMKSHGSIKAIGVEGSGFYGAALTQFLLDAGHRVVEVNRPNPSARRANGKSDRLDAEQAARAVLGKTATAVPKTKTGVVEAIRILRVTRSSAVKARSQSFNALHGIVVGAPSPLRDELIGLTKRTLVNRCLGLRPETSQLLALSNDRDRLLLAAAKTALRDLARRWKALDEEVKELSNQIKDLVEQAAPELVDLFGVGTELAGQFLVTAGGNPERIRNEAAFAKLCGVAPQPASSGRTNGRHRLSRSGDRAANSALYTVTIVRMRHHPATIEYVQRRTAEGLTKREIIRCLKRYIAREIFKALPRAEAQPPLPNAA